MVESPTLHIFGSLVVSTKYGRQSTEGYAHDGRLSVDGACNQEPDGYKGTRHKIYTGSAAVLA